MRGQCDKARFILANLLAMSVDANELNWYRSDYLNSNRKQLAQETLEILEQVRLQLELQLKVDINKLIQHHHLECSPQPRRLKL